MPMKDKPKKKREGEEEEDDAIVEPNLEELDLDEDGSEPDDRRRDPLRRPV